MSGVAATFPIQGWENENGPRGATNTAEGLTHSSDLGREGLGMKPTSKRCARCEQTLPAEAFTADPRYRSGLKSYCRNCSRAYARELYARNPPKARAGIRRRAARVASPANNRRRHIRAMYGLTMERYDALLASQGGRCAICRAPAPGGKGDWHVDHCHETGEVRGLLCAGCNVGLGHLKDDPARLRAAANYIEKHRENAS